MQRYLLFALALILDLISLGRIESGRSPFQPKPVKQIEILTYRESHGGEIRLPAWRRQFVGKTSAAPLRIGDDIANISGATLSCTHLAEGVRRVVAIVARARRDGSLA